MGSVSPCTVSRTLCGSPRPGKSTSVGFPERCTCIDRTIDQPLTLRDTPQNGLGLGVPGGPHLLPPGPDRLHGKLRRVVADPHTDPGFVLLQVIYPVGGD